MPRTTVTVTRCSVSGTLTLSAIIEGHLVTRRYIGYTRRAAISLFRSHVS